MSRMFYASVSFIDLSNFVIKDTTETKDMLSAVWNAHIYVKNQDKKNKIIASLLIRMLVTV